MAWTLRNLGEFERWWLPGAARWHYERSVALFRKVDDPLTLAHTVRHLGDVYYYAGRTTLAEPCYHEALALYREHENVPSLNFANAVRSLAILKESTGEPDEARRVWQETHDLYAAVNATTGVAESAAWLAILAHRQGDRKRSHEWLNEASLAADASRDPDSLKFIRKVRTQIGE